MIADPASLLYVTGSLEEANDNAIAIVGTRHPTAGGRAFTEELSRNLATLGFTIVSGLPGVLMPQHTVER